MHTYMNKVKVADKNSLAGGYHLKNMVNNSIHHCPLPKVDVVFQIKCVILAKLVVVECYTSIPDWGAPVTTLNHAR